MKRRHHEEFAIIPGREPIPQHWKAEKLRHLLKINPAPSTALRGQPDNLVTFLPMEAIGEDGSLSVDRRRPIRELLTGYSYFAAGDVIMAKVTPCFENGKAAAITSIPTNFGFGTSEVTTLRPGDRIDQKFLFYLIHSDRFRQSSIASMTGAGGLKRVPDEHIRTFEVGLPDKTEQQTIVEFLDRETTKIDALIAKQEQLIATLREDRAGTIKQAVLKGLDPKADMQSVHADFPSLPAHWSVVPIKRLGKLLTGGTPPTLGRSGFTEPDGVVPWYRPEDLETTGAPSVASRRLSSAESAFASPLPPPSIHVVSIGATLGKIGYVTVPAMSNQQITALVSTDFPRFMYYALVASFDRIWAASMGNTLPIISAGRLGAVLLALPPRDEQEAIAAFLDRRCFAIDAVIAKSAAMIAILREYRSALITDAVTGKIDVRGVA